MRLVDGSPEHITKRKLIGELATTYRMPTIYPFRSFVEAGGFISYGIDLVEIFRRAAHAIDQVLKGAKPAELLLSANQVRACNQPQG